MSDKSETANPNRRKMQHGILENVTCVARRSRSPKCETLEDCVNKLDTTKFTDACIQFENACERGRNWRENYFGAAYSTRLTQAVHEMEAAIRSVRDALRADENDR
jgi:hypothetical protein